MSVFEERIEYQISNVWERQMDGEVCGIPNVKINVIFPNRITPDNNFLKDIDSIFQKIEKEYNERLSEQKES